MIRLLSTIAVTMGIFGFGDKDLSYKALARWLDDALSEELPYGIEAFCFNLYDDGNGIWSIELIGSSSFDKDNTDWPCDEIYTNRNTPLRWKSRKTWEGIQSLVESHLKYYIRKGKHRDILTSKKGIGLGFVDGDLVLL